MIMDNLEMDGINLLWICLFDNGLRHYSETV